ncbi:1-phosphatidylinositol 3-phosphate 5-kinase-like isoform X2 [Stegodyphus dumicola]|uniref:1-phosphatidylinositol 3-phosphate 5-kinase-like isoform X2 n=1 Tax=Stegodyphus dumicola TaxID=202533 RepID=UPI0015AC4388|nr:1-phosphatidylinositol 3-phosphate 5-kinase-like isoform X2 [Stegodyphus dumicola]
MAMAKKLESRTSLTQFAPLSPESKSQTFSIRNIFWKSKEKSASTIKAPEQSEDKTSDVSNSSQSLYSDESTFSSGKDSDIANIENNRGTSGILGRIMDNILDNKKKSLQNYKDSDFKQYWMPDSNCKECYECGDRFTTFRRRHHCRVCGQIFCRRCCSQEIPGGLIGYTDDLRVCSYCCDMVLSCVRSLYSVPRTDEDTPSFHENQPQKRSTDFSSETLTSPLGVMSPARRKSSVVGFREEDIARAKSFKSALSNMTYRERQSVQKNDGTLMDRAYLKDLMNELITSVHSISLWKQEYKDHYTKVVLGCDIVDWLMAHNSSLTRSDAINIGQAFIDAQLFECIMPQQLKFIDGNVFYKPVELPQFEAPIQTDNVNEIQESMEPLWVKEIQPSDNYIVKDSNGPGQEDAIRFKVFDDYIQDTFDGTLIKVLNKDSLDNSVQKSIISSKTWHHSQLREDNGEKVAFEKLNLMYKNHEETLLNQLLSNEGLSLSWADIILPIIHHVVNSVHPDVKNDADDMDIRQYVQFKKITGGNKSESTIISGVVFSKTVAHKKMRQKIESPTILLLSSAISYQRVWNKLSSLDPILMQEFEYLKNTIGKLTVFKPDILLVEKTVSRIAQEMLLGLGVTLAVNVKPSVMERVARSTQAAIVSTVDPHLGRPQLGHCETFKVKTFPSLGGKSKTLMFFDGCPENLGCTILLRGGSGNELKKVKQVVQFMVYVAYNWHLERSFLMDEFAFPPSSLCEEMDISDEDSLVEVKPEEKKDEITSMESDVQNQSVPLPDSNKSNDKNLTDNLCKKNKSKFDDSGRKLETESISDFSDPLHSYLQLENDVFPNEPFNLKVDTLPVPNTFSKLLDDIILCISLNIKPTLPFLETDAGKKCVLRKFFPQEIYWSRHFTKENDVEILHQIDAQIDFDDENLSFKGLAYSRNVEILPYHKFISYRITDVVKSSIETQSLLADFRARGGTIKYLCPHERVAKEKEKKLVDNHQIVKEHSKASEVNTSTGLCWEKKVDALDPYNHQSLAVLFSSYSCASDNAPNYCVSPWVVKMEYYGSNDITLGGFLDRYCFRSSYVCPSASCVTPMTEHVRKFVHGSGCVHILLHELGTGLQAAENNILMWSWCHKCKKATPVVSMSQDTWSFSFAKYLELRFYADGYKRRGSKELCSHSLHHDHYQYFAKNQLVAIFKYTPVFIWELAFPSFIISVLDKAIPVTSLIEQIKVIAMKGHAIYSDLLAMLFALRKEYTGSSSEDFVDDMINMLQLEMPSFRGKIEDIQLRLTSPTLETLKINLAEDIDRNKDVCNFMWKIEDQIILLKYHIAEVAHVWNNRIQEFISARKKEQKLHSKLTPQTSKTSEEDTVVKGNSLSSEERTMELAESNVVDTVCSELEHVSAEKIGFEIKLESSKLMKNHLKKKFSKLTIPKRSLSCENITELVMPISSESTLVRSKSEPECFICLAEEFDLKNKFDRECSVSSSDSSFTYGVTPGIYAGLKVTEPENYENYVICHKDSVEENLPVTKQRKHHERSKSETEAIHTINRQISEKSSVDGAKPEKKERSVKAILSQFLSSSAVNPIENPFSNLEHLLLPLTQKLPVIVHEEEPSSIIAYALASDDYEQKLQELKLNITNTINISQKDSQTSSPLLKHRPNSKIQSENSRTDGHFSSDDMFDFSIDATEKGHVKPASKISNFHIEIQFTDNTTRFYCRVYYAEQFRKLRGLIFTEGEERYIRSLSHCVQWIARGGKSGSMFCKTHDDRFILKQMPRLELQSFMDLAPSYFQYLNKAYLEQKPTVLAKIVGIYRIGFKNTTTNAATKMDLLVMENLFYNRNVSRKYDLKGSIRNRLVNTSRIQEEDIVLLDENLLKITCDNPLYVRPHSKTVLTLAISNDTQFLVDQSVMDYSLLVGLDEEKGELVIGIIDYIRTFTWDKKVEMLIKSSGILGGHGKMPTVVSPELYKMRFCEAMDSYFLWIPDQWTGLGKGVDG